MEEKLMKEKLMELEKRLNILEKQMESLGVEIVPGSDEVKTENEELHQALSKTGEGARALTGVGIKMFKKGLSGLGKQLSKLDDTNKVVIDGEGEQN